MPKIINALLALSSLSVGASGERSVPNELSTGARALLPLKDLASASPYPVASARPLAQASFALEPTTSYGEMLGLKADASPLPYTQNLRGATSAAATPPPGWGINCLSGPSDDVASAGAFSLALGCPQAEADFIASALKPYGIHRVTGCFSPATRLDTGMCYNLAQVWYNHITGAFNATTAARVIGISNDACIQWNILHPSASPTQTPVPTHIPGVNCISPGYNYSLILVDFTSPQVQAFSRALSSVGLGAALGCPYPVEFLTNDTLCGGQAAVMTNYYPQRDPVQAQLITDTVNTTCSQWTPSASPTASETASETASATASSSATATEGGPAPAAPASNSFSPTLQESLIGAAAAAGAAVLIGTAAFFGCRAIRKYRETAGSAASQSQGDVVAAATDRAALLARQPASAYGSLN